MNIIKLILRIIVAPFLGAAFFCVMCFLPYWLIFVGSAASILAMPVYWAANLEQPEPFLGDGLPGHIVSLLFPIWSPFAVMIQYIINPEETLKELFGLNH